MKYLLAPFGRVLIVIVCIFIIVPITYVVGTFRFLWDFKKEHVTKLWHELFYPFDGDHCNESLNIEEPRMYCYKTPIDYIINKKTYYK